MKILFLTASYGTGHVTANKWTQQALVKSHPEVDTLIVDFLKDKDYSQSGSIFNRFYNWSMEMPIIWDKIFDLSNSFLAHFYFKNIFARLYHSFYRLFKEEKPDLFVTTHPYWNFIIENYKNRFKEHSKCVTIVTDSTAIHRTWITSGVDYYIVADEESKTTLKVLGVDEGKLFVAGFPVNPELGEPFDKKSFLTKLGMETGIPTVLVVVGLGDVKKFIKIVHTLGKQVSFNFQIIVITGKYRTVYRTLNKRGYLVRTKILGWTNRMADFLRASDIVISKGGGAIVMETLAAGKPIIIPVFTPGQERGNAKLIMKYGLGYAGTALSEVFRYTYNLLSLPQRLTDLQNHVRRFSKPDAAKNIAEFIYKIR